MSPPKTRNKGRDKTWNSSCEIRLERKTIFKLMVCVVILVGIGVGVGVGVQSKKVENKEMTDSVKGKV